MTQRPFNSSTQADYPLNPFSLFWIFIPSLIIDSLVYGYNANSNQLNYVTDKMNDTAYHLGDFTEINNNNSPDYSYDGNGNLVMDNNKGIDRIAYNYLNLPQTIHVQHKGTISYTYDAGGNKLQKTTMDSTVSKKMVTTYIGPFVYQYSLPFSGGSPLDSLQFIMQPEGRIRPKNVGLSDTMYYDFFEKDHLGNTRVVLTDQMQQDIYPAADLENNSGALATEQAYYTINLADTVNVNSIASWPATTGNNYPNNNGNPPYNNNPGANTSATSSIVYRLNGSTGDKTGLGITLKVMTGDIIDIYGKSFYHLNTGQTPDNSHLITSALANFIASFAGTPTVAGAAKGATASALNNSTATTGGLNGWLGSVPNPGTASIPRAYINWILFDAHFVVVTTGCGFDGVSTSADAVKSHHSTVSIPVGGYLYVYCSNESNVDVFFDNLQVIDTRGPLLETTNYYPFGLTMAGISDKALKAGYLENKYRFQKQELQNKEFSDGSGLEMYEFKYRMDDPQTGRFWQIDPLADKYVYNSTYAFSENKVTSTVELEGLESSPLGYGYYPGITPEQANGIAKGMEETHAKGAQVAKRLAIMVTMAVEPLVGVPLAITDLTGVPVTPSPQAAASMMAEGAAVPALDETGNLVVGGASDQTMTLYRGVNESHVGYADALEGTAKPQGGNATPAEHNEGNTASEFTSWTTNPDVATNFALRPSGTGVVLKTTVKQSATVASPSGKWVTLKQSPGTRVNENEVLMRGGIYGAQVTQQ